MRRWKKSTCLQARRIRLTKTYPAGTLVLNIQPPNCENINLCCISHTVCGILLWQLKKTNTVTLLETHFTKGKRKCWSLSHARLFATPWIAACQASLSSLSPRACSNSCPLSFSSTYRKYECRQNRKISNIIGGKNITDIQIQKEKTCI